LLLESDKLLQHTSQAWRRVSKVLVEIIFHCKGRKDCVVH
jgi:hypothetical protein